MPYIKVRGGREGCSASNSTRGLKIGFIKCRLQFLFFGQVVFQYLNIIGRYQHDRGHWNVNYTGTQSFTATLSYLLAQIIWVLLLNLDSKIWHPV